MTLKRKSEHAADQGAQGANNHRQGDKPKPPGHRYRNYEHPSEEEHRTAEQFNWRYSYALNVGIAFAAVSAAVFAAGSFVEANRQANAAWEANRAWLAPTGIVFDVPLRVGLPIVVNVGYENIGHEPATFVTNIGVVELFPRNVLPQNLGSWDNPKFLPPCSDIDIIKSGDVLYPSNQGKSNDLTWKAAFQFSSAKPLVLANPPEDNAKLVLTGKSVLFVEGCFRYTTLNTVRHSRVCFYFAFDGNQPASTWNLGTA